MSEVQGVLVTGVFDALEGWVAPDLQLALNALNPLEIEIKTLTVMSESDRKKMERLRLEVAKVRIETEKDRRVVKRPLLKLGKHIDSEAKNIREACQAVEKIAKAKTDQFMNKKKEEEDRKTKEYEAEIDKVRDEIALFLRIAPDLAFSNASPENIHKDLARIEALDGAGIVEEIKIAWLASRDAAIEALKVLGGRKEREEVEVKERLREREIKEEKQREELAKVEAEKKKLLRQQAEQLLKREAEDEKRRKDREESDRRKAELERKVKALEDAKKAEEIAKQKIIADAKAEKEKEKREAIQEKRKAEEAAKKKMENEEYLREIKAAIPVVYGIHEKISIIHGTIKDEIQDLQSLKPHHEVDEVISEYEESVNEAHLTALSKLSDFLGKGKKT